MLLRPDRRDRSCSGPLPRRGDCSGDAGRRATAAESSPQAGGLLKGGRPVDLVRPVLSPGGGIALITARAAAPAGCPLPRRGDCSDTTFAVGFHPEPSPQAGGLLVQTPRPAGHRRRPLPRRGDCSADDAAFAVGFQSSPQAGGLLPTARSPPRPGAGPLPRRGDCSEGGPVMADPVRSSPQAGGLLDPADMAPVQAPVLSPGGGIARM